MQETAGETHHVQGLKPFYPLCNPLILLWNKQIQVEIPWDLKDKYKLGLSVATENTKIT